MQLNLHWSFWGKCFENVDNVHFEKKMESLLYFSHISVVQIFLTNERMLFLHTSDQTFCRVFPKLLWQLSCWPTCKLLAAPLQGRHLAQLLVAGNWFPPVKMYINISFQVLLVLKYIYLYDNNWDWLLNFADIKRLIRRII